MKLVFYHINLFRIFQLKCSKVVLDGEILAFDTLSESYVPFGSNRTVAARQKKPNELISSSCHMCYMVFDILFYQTSLDSEPTDLTNTLLKIRRRILEEMVQPEPTRLEVRQYFRVNRLTI